MKVLLTGNRGFIGSHLQKRLEQEGHTVVGCDIVDGKDIQDLTQDNFLDVDFVIHLAGSANLRESLNDPWLYFENNAKKTKKLQRMSYDTATPFLYASSSSIHHWYLSPYGTSKLMTEMSAQPGQVGMRFTTVYGKGGRDTMLTAKIQNGTLKHCTNHIRDFVDVEDVIDAIMIFVNTGLEGKLPVYDIGTGIGKKVSDVVRAAGLDVPVVEGLPCEADDNTCESKEMKALGWNPKRDIFEYVRKK